MTGSENHQISLTESSCECSRLGADVRSVSTPRVLIAVPGFYRQHRRNEMVAELADVFKGRGYQSRVCTYSDSSKSGSSLLRHIRYLKDLSRLLAAFDVLHLIFHPGLPVFLGMLPIVLLAKFFGKKVVLDYRTPVVFSQGATGRFFIERMWRLCDRVLVLSAYQRQLVSSFGGVSVYIRAGVDLERIQPRIIRNLQPHVVVATDLEREHNVASAIRAFKLVKQKYPRTEMTIIGTGAEDESLKGLVERENIIGINFAGAVSPERRAELMNGGDVYLSCSSVDYLSTATAEAFAMGLPVLTTPLTGAGEVLRSRDNIILLPYNDHVGTAERIIELIENPDLTEKLSRNARLTREAYGSDRRRDEWNQLYRCLFQRCD